MMSAGQGAPTIHTPEQPPESAYKGKWRNLKDGFVYGHAIAEHPTGKTHKAMIPRQEEKQDDGTMKLIHTGLFWEGTEEEFHATFRKE